MLTGEFNHSIDSKGRLIIPSKLRESLGEHFVITKGMDGCLFLYPDNEWKAFEEKLRTLPLTNKKARDFKRFFLGSATEGELDKQGRVLISSSLRAYADLEKEVVLAVCWTRSRSGVKRRGKRVQLMLRKISRTLQVTWKIWDLASK